ncbi:FxSxx-COOH system tetratricopeptide repeat protein [Streptomyces sp. FIT100]|uniref:FxSxx-COOH system tetratricopeptide repeat protein n=1 Tax=Streptomyces sp. FIT100 TaxID=2837956 RepID=UPI0021FE4243|nr:tetratricopeptide repeat protein [Streptomyces sp. FIT100]
MARLKCCWIRKSREWALSAARTSAATGDGQSVTISFAGFNRAWAAWIGDRLEQRGHRVTYLRWDPPPHTALADALGDLLLAPGKILVILSEWYFQLGPRTHTEWNEALRDVVVPAQDRFAAVNITSAVLPTATAVFAAPELWPVAAAEAERRALAALGLPADRAGDPARSAGPRFPREDPEVWGGVPRRNVRFTGREQLLGDVYHQLQQAERGAAVCTLYGMPGVGKTQLAAEYVYRFGSEYDVVWWVPADKRATFREQLAKLAPALGLNTGHEYGERLRALREALRRGTPYSRWLLVLDGADEPEWLTELLPTGPGHVLITSRNRDWREYNSTMLEIPVYQREESIAFIRRRAPRLGRPDADQLADALEDVPLLLDQTAGWLGDSDMSIGQYLDLLGSGAEHVVKVSKDFPTAFPNAWSILLNQLKETVPESIDLLRLCSFFSSGTIPVRLLRELADRDLPPQFTRLLGDPLLWNRALNQLFKYSVVRREVHEPQADEASGGDTLYMHRMVHKMVQDDIPPEDREMFADVVRQALAAADPGRPTDTRQWPRYAEIAPHLKTASVLESDRREVQTLVLNTMRYMYLAGEYSAGLTLATATLESWRERLGETHSRIWDVSYHYANLLRATGNYAGTEVVDRAVMDHLVAERGFGDLDTLRAAAGLAADLRGLARYDEAHDLSRRILDGYTELVGEQDSRTVNAQNNLAVSLRLLGRYEDALRLDLSTLEARRALLRPRHAWTLYSEIHYATDLRLLGRYPEAISVQDLSARVHQQVMGPHNPQTLRAEHNLALCQYRQGDRPRAGELLASVVRRAETALGESDPVTQTAALAHSAYGREHGVLDEARAQCEAVGGRYLAVLGPRHPYTIGTNANLALILRAAGEREQSQLLMDEALDGMERAVGADHPWTLGCALNATAARNLAGDPEGAEALSRDTVRRAREVLGERHPLTLSALVALAADLRALRKRAEADKVEEEALAGLAASLGAQHVHTVSARSRTRPYWDFEPLIT